MVWLFREWTTQLISEKVRPCLTKYWKLQFIIRTVRSSFLYSFIYLLKPKKDTRLRKNDILKKSNIFALYSTAGLDLLSLVCGSVCILLLFFRFLRGTTLLEKDSLQKREDPGPESHETAVQIDDQQFHFQDGGRSVSSTFHTAFWSFNVNVNPFSCKLHQDELVILSCYFFKCNLRLLT